MTKKLRIVLYMFTFLYLLGFIIVFKPYPGVRVENEFLKYESEYKQLLKENCPKIKVNNYDIAFNNLPNNAVGLCLEYKLKFVIYIDKEYWDANPGINERKSLLFHEFSHCFLKLDHSKDRLNYMYFETNEMSNKELIRQVKLDIIDTCKRL